MNTDELLAERGKTHGDFQDNARISQQLKAVIHANGYGGLSDVQREALDVICLKLSRILSGQANEPDHWDDIAGYARLASQSINPTPSAPTPGMFPHRYEPEKYYQSPECKNCGHISHEKGKKPFKCNNCGRSFDA